MCSLDPQGAPETIPDPGRLWRRLARVGAALTVLAMVVPTGPKGKSIAEIILFGWGRLAHSRQVLLSGAESIDLADFLGYLSSLYGTICTIPFVSGLVAWFLCGRGRIRSGAERVFRTTLLVSGVLVAAGTVYVIFLFLFSRVMGLLWIPHVVLFLAALAILDGWHRRESVLCEFWPGTFLVMSACVAWGFLAYVSVALFTGFQGAVVKWSIGSLVNVWSAGMLGSVMTAVGWLLWWRALRRSPNPNL